MAALCHRRETAKRVELQQRAKRQPPSQQARPEPDFPLLMLAMQCPRCIDDFHLLYGERTFKYGRPATRNSHFNSKRLKERHSLGQKELPLYTHTECVEGGVPLVNMNHFPESRGQSSWGTTPTPLLAA